MPWQKRESPTVTWTRARRDVIFSAEEGAGEEAAGDPLLSWANVASPQGGCRAAWAAPRCLLEAWPGSFEGRKHRISRFWALPGVHRVHSAVSATAQRRSRVQLMACSGRLSHLGERSLAGGDVGLKGVSISRPCPLLIPFGIDQIRGKGKKKKPNAEFSQPHTHTFLLQPSAGQATPLLF